MDIDKIAIKLRSAHEQYNPVIEKRDKIISQEANALRALYKKFSPFSTTRIINGQKALLIYVYKDSNLDLISDEVYLTESGKITYQCFNQGVYKEIVPDAKIKNGYVEVEMEYFLENIPLIRIVNFFDERASVLLERAYATQEMNEKRINLMKHLQQKQ